MNSLKKISVFILSAIGCGLLISTVQSCKDSLDQSSSLSDGTDAKFFFTNLKSDLDNMETRYKSSKTRAFGVSTGQDKLTPVYVDNQDLNLIVNNDLDALIGGGIDNDPVLIAPIYSLYNLMAEFEVDFSLTKSDIYCDSILISEEDAIETLSPMVVHSRAYLIAKGFTDGEIDEMLAENNVTEEALIPFVIAVSAVENDDAADDDMLSMCRKNQSLFAVSSYAFNINWHKAGDCAVKALANDLVGAIRAGMTSKIVYKAALKVAFKSAVKEITGPIGVAFTLYDFGYCYFKN
jgi:hypothetical protein